jgi:hypothetical protein
MSDKSVQITLSTDELKALIQEAVRDALLELLGEDLNSEPRFTPEIAERLKTYRQQKPSSLPIDDVVRELGLDA